MPLKLALIGNPNSGKTTLFNILTGSNQTIGNWPGVTVEKKEGRLVSDSSVVICDLPGVYSLSPYTSEETIVQNYLENERPDLILNIVDASNLERNLYLTTQIIELGIPVIIALNMIDVIKKHGYIINTQLLSKSLGCKIIEISAVQKKGINELNAAVTDVNNYKTLKTDKLKFDFQTEKALSDIIKIADIAPDNFQRRYSVKLFERDICTYRRLKINSSTREKLNTVISSAEHRENDTGENIITNRRYYIIEKICRECLTAPKKRKKDITEKIDNIVTNKFLAYPIFILVMTLVYMLSLGNISRAASDFISDGLFGQGWHFLGVGSSEFELAASRYSEAQAIIKEFEKEKNNSQLSVTAYLYDENGNVIKKIAATKADYENALTLKPPDPSEYGVWILGIEEVTKRLLSALNCSENISSLITDGIIAGVGSVLGFIPHMLILFLCLAFLEGCGYMARIAFITDKILSCFGLSGKSFIPIIIGTGCGVPGIISSRTIESESDKVITITTTTFMPCSAKLPLISLITGTFFEKTVWGAPFVYIISILSIMLSGIILKHIKRFSGGRTPFIMEMPPYHLPKASVIFKNVSERITSFIKKAGTVIVLASIIVWLLSNYGISGKSIVKCEIQNSFLALAGMLIAPIFEPLGWGSWQFSVSSVSGIIAKENIVSTLSILFKGNNLNYAVSSLLSQNAALSFMIFNVLCAPCLAAIAAIFREMHSIRRGTFAILYQCFFAYITAFAAYKISFFILPLFIFVLFAAVKLQKRKSAFLVTA